MKNELNDLLPIVALTAIYSVFNLCMSFGFFPVTEGWFQDYTRYLSDGSFIYRDFYCHIGPGYVWLFAAVCRLFNYSYFALRLIGVIERVIILLLIYCIVRRVFNRMVSFVSVLTGAVIFTANYQDLYYGYYQTSFLFIILSLYFLLKCHESIDDKKKSLIFAFLFGLSSGIAFLIKQNAGFIFAVVLGISFLFINKAKIKRALGLMLISFVCAVFVGLVSLLILFVNGALSQFFEQILGGASSKGSLLTIFVGRIPQLIHGDAICLVLYCVLFICLLKWCDKKKEDAVWKYIGYVTRVLIVVFVISYSYLYLFKSLFVDVKSSLIIILWLTISMLFLFATKFFDELREDVFYLISLLFLSIFFIFCSQRKLISIDYLMLRENRQVLLYGLFFWNIVMIVWDIYKRKQSKNEYFLYLYIASFAIMYIHTMSGILEDHGTWLIVTLTVGTILSVKTPLNEVKNFYTYCICLLLMVCVFIQKVELPYHWWGVNECAPIYEAAYEYDDPLLKGLKGSKESTETINAIYKTLKDEKEEGDTLYSFPHIDYFNVSQDMDSPTFAKVHYFDVCPDDVAESDAKTLEENPPDFIVWMDISEDEWDAHEGIFRSGNRRGQRDIQDWYKEVTESGDYELLGKYIIEDSSPVYAWKKSNRKK